jgi:hypothetical protein
MISDHRDPAGFLRSAAPAAADSTLLDLISQGSGHAFAVLFDRTFEVAREGVTRVGSD